MQPWKIQIEVQSTDDLQADISGTFKTHGSHPKEPLIFSRVNNSVKALPNRISPDIFHSYYFCCIEQQHAWRNTGIVIDDGLFEFIFLRESDIQVESQGHRTSLPHAFIIGKVEIPSRLIIPHTMTYFTVKIQPWVASFFLEKDYTAVNDLAFTSSPDLQQLHHHLFSTTCFEEQIRHVEDYFLNQELPNLHNSEVSRQMCNYIYEAHGNVKVKDLVSLFPYSRQRLNQLFLSQTKNSIKEFAVLTRLRSIMTYYMKHPEQTLTSIAYQFGYSDQSHFIKDMKKVTGVTPSEFSQTNNVFYEQIKTEP